jgi:hypothetical protein
VSLRWVFEICNCTAHSKLQCCSLNAYLPTSLLVPTASPVDDSLRSQQTACAYVGDAATQPPVYESATKRFPEDSTNSTPPSTAAKHAITFDKPGTYEYVCTVGSGSHCRRGMYQQVVVKGGGPAV